MEKSDIVLILPGGIDAFYDLFFAIKLKKEIFLYNKDFFYTPIIKYLYDLYLKGVIEKGPSEYMNIESELENIILKIKERY